MNDDDDLTPDDLPEPEKAERVDPDELSVDGDNPNEMGDDTFDLLVENMKQKGWLSGPIIADMDGTVADGEHRLRAARELDLDEVPVRFYDITDEERRLWRLELNKIRGEHDTKRDALEYDLLLNTGYADDVHDLTSSIGEDLDELLAEIKVETDRSPSYEYDSDHNVRFQDCVEGMADLDDNSVDCVITDPPYGIDYQSNWSDPDDQFDTIDNDDYEDALATYAAAMEEIERVLKPTGHLYTFTRWDVYPDFLARTQRETISVDNCLIWYKKRGGLGDLAGNYASDHEFIIFATGDDARDLQADTRPRNVLRHDPALGDEYDHPTQKPVPLVADLLTNSTSPGDTVLDPFMGSGATAVAAIQHDRDYIGFEVDDEYRPVIERRIGEAKRQREASVNERAATDGGGR